MGNEVQVYMLQDTSDRGTRFSADYIYSVEKHVAEEMEHQEVAKVVAYPSLASIDKEIEAAAEALKAEVETIERDVLLSEQGKSVKKQEFLSSTKKQIEALGERYNKELEALKKNAQRQASETKRQADYNADQVAENVGIIVSEVHMSSSFTQALEAVQQQLNFIDQGTARRLLSQFAEVKRVLDEKGTHINGADRYVQDLYKAVKAAATNEQQATNSQEYRILQRVEATRKFSGHYPSNFRAIEKRIK